jgi:predicted HTH transcriptional regulator
MRSTLSCETPDIRCASSVSIALKLDEYRVEALREAMVNAVAHRRYEQEPSVEALLNDRQKEMVILLAQGDKLTSRDCEERFGVSRVTLASDFKLLIELKFAMKQGGGRSTGYVWRIDNR